MKNLPSVVPPQSIYRLLALFAVLALNACGNDDSSKTSTGDANYNQLWTDVFSTRCGSCHGASNTDTLGGPDMRTQDAFHSGMVGKKGSDYPDWDTFQTNRADCLDVPFISAGNPSQSLLVAIFDNSVAPCNVKSHTEPPQSIALTSTQLATLKNWITNGAAR
jgi:hypothetical protein